MPQIRWDYLQRKKAESGQTGTAQYDLPKTGFMRDLILTAYFTPTGANAPSAPLSDVLTKIEIVDGGHEIMALTGNQIKALSMIDGHNPLGSTEKNDNSVEGYDHFMMNLGGVFDGQRYAPDMSVFSNPQIRITWDASSTTTEFGMTTEADTTPAMKFSLVAQMQNDSGGLRHGYIRSRIVKEYSQSGAGTNVIQLDTDEDMIGFGIEAGYTALDFTEDVEEIKLDVNNGAWVPFHFKEEEVMQFQQQVFKKPFQYSWMTDIEDSDEFDSHMGYLLHLIAQGKGDTNEPKAYAFEITRKGVETMYITDTRTPTACGTLEQTYLTAIGWAPFHMWYCPMKTLLGDTDVLVGDPKRDMDLEIVAGSSASASSTPDVIARYLRT